MNYFTTMESPLGEITIQACDEGVLGVWFATHTTRPADLGKKQPDHPLLEATVVQLDAYFSGQRRSFDLPLVFKGTAFQQQVWQALTAIPYGEVCSYKQLAEAIGRPNAVRAVGAANGKNPLSVLVPCHRVIGANGKLTGYAGGTERKAALLALEKEFVQHK